MLPRLPESDMSVSCSPSSLVEGAKCFSTCLLNEELSAIELWLLTQIAGTTADVQTLLNRSRCLENCVEHGNAEAVIVWLLSRIANINSDPNSLMSAARCIEACIIPEESKAIDVSLEVQIAGATSDPTTLLNNARCFRLCAADWRGTAIKIWLLATEAGMSTDPATLIGSANCLLGCLNHDQLKLIETYLWCQISNETPEIPETISGLAHWWRADSLIGIVSDGNPVGDVGKEWICKVTGILANQANPPDRPLFVTNWRNGQPALQMGNAVDEFFLNLSAMYQIAGDATIVSVIQCSDAALCTLILFGDIAGFGRIAAIESIGTSTPQWVGDDNVDAGFPNFAGGLSSPNSCSFRRSGLGANNCNAWINNGDIQIGSLDSAVTVNAIIGNASGTHHAYIAELLHYNRALSNAELTTLFTSYISPRYSLP